MRFPAALLLTLTLAPRAASALPASAAILPAFAPTSDDDLDLSNLLDKDLLDQALHQALATADDIALVSAKDTRQQLTSLADMGLVCSSDDVQCLVKIGLASSVSWLLVPVVTGTVGRTVAVRIAVVDVGKAVCARTVTGEVALEDQVAISALVRRALPRARAADSRTNDPPKDVMVRSNERAPEQSAPSAGAMVAGFGVVVAGVSLVSATVVELVFANVIPANVETRTNIKPVGAVLWGTTLLGAAAIGTGLFLWSAAPLAEQDTAAR